MTLTTTDNRIETADFTFKWFQRQSSGSGAHLCTKIQKRGFVVQRELDVQHLPALHKRGTASM